MSTTTAVVNGVDPPAHDANGLNGLDEIAEFQKILKLRDEVLTGNHPRLTVPAHALRKVSPASTQLSSHSSVPILPQQPVPVPAPIAAPIPAPPQLPGLTLTQNDEPPKQTTISTPPIQPPIITTSSGINPVLLTKSDDLIKAETALQRQRLEKQLRDQFEQKRLDFRKRPAPAEAKPDFDISALLVQSLEIVKPVSLSKEPSDKEDENESFDENSFYSSRAPDSPPDRASPSPSSPGEVVEEGATADGPLPQNAQRDLPRPSSRTAVDPVLASKPSAPSNVYKKPQNNADVMDVDDDDEEGEYSPPEAEPLPAQPNGSGSHQIPDPRSRHLRKYSDLDQNGKRAASPSEPNMRIVRNHITSPYAPQPSRVSPLALTKDSLVSQDRRYQNGPRGARANSPSQSPENVGQRNKRRKLERRNEKRNKKGNVKNEPISPPPFHDIQPLGQAKMPQSDDRPIIIDEPPQPREIRYVQAPRYVESPQRPMSRQAEYVPLSEPRVLSRATIRPRDEQDLRRVASMHNMRAEQPREYVEYASPTRQRAASYMRVDSPMREVPREYAQENDRPLQEIRVVRTPAPEYREVYQSEPEVRYIPEPMPPPPQERIVVDQYGRRFREIVQERAPAPPRAVSYGTQPAQHYDNYVPVRAGSIMVEERPLSQRYEPDMLPPRVVRQVADQPGDQPRSATREVYEPQSAVRPGSVAVYERPQSRQVVYADAPDDFRPPMRMASVRPPPSRYEELPPPPVPQMMPRAASVRPDAQEGNVFLDDRASVRREYIPHQQSAQYQPQVIEQPRYRVVEQEPQLQMQPQPRYVDAQGREIIPQQGDSGVRYVQRYQ